MRTTPRQEPGEADLSIILSVERGLGILGKDGKETILRYLEKSGMPVELVPRDIDAFVGLLRGMFGMGSMIIEGEIESSLRLMEGLNRKPVSLQSAAAELRGRGSLG